ncbi:ABC transporter permease [Mesorhizobium sp.]|uniref:ABC transporter permease n=1 Tax=Mesorhizobium sp. TaxID=1871066 RepID=UPI00257DE002|nr:ABC transporter permease [Mesorhizobium sp.]
MPHSDTAVVPGIGMARVRNAPGLALLLVAIALAGLVYGAATTPSFLTPFNLGVVVRAAAFVGIMAVGLTFVTISGNFFLLSVTEIAALSSIIFAFSVNQQLGIVAVLVLTLGTAAVLGAAQGAVIGLGANPIVVTLAFGSVIFGVAAYFSDAQMILVSRPNPFEWLGAGLTFGVPNVTWVFLLIAAAGELVLKRTTFGRRIYLSGDNRATATAIGNRAFAMAVQVCSIAALAGGLVGILFSAQMSAGYVNHFTGAMGASGSLTLNAIAAVMIGGTAIAGGAGSALRSAAGAIFIALIDNMMVLRGYETGPRILFVGLVIVVSVAAYSVIKKARR